MIKANSKMVPGQCAEYSASSVFPERLRPTEYNRHIKAKTTGYHLNINSLNILNIILLKFIVK